MNATPGTGLLNLKKVMQDTPNVNITHEVNGIFYANFINSLFTTFCFLFKVKHKLNLPSSFIPFLQIQLSRHHQSAQMEPSTSIHRTALTRVEI